MNILRKMLALLLIVPTMVSAQSSPFTCSSGFASSGACGWINAGSGQPFASWGTASPTLSGTSLILMQSGFTHGVSSLIYQTKVNAQAFASTFTFVPNGQNITFVIENSNNDPFEPQPYRFVGGAGCEAGFYQSSMYVPNFVVGIELDSYSPLTKTGNFTYSSAQLYQSTAVPCLPPNGGEAYWFTTNKLSTSPVRLTLASGTGNGCTASPGNGCGTTTGDTYSATVVYTAGNVTLNLFDVTAGGTCTPTTSGTCFSQTWSGVNIPSIIGANTGYIGLTTATGNPASTPLYIKSFTDTTTTAPSSPPVQTYTSAASSGSAFVATPTLSPVAGTYATTQSVVPSSTTANVYYCFTLSPTIPALMPQTDGQGGCSAGILVSGAISISASSTLYLMGGINVLTQPNTAEYSRLPSNLIEAVYTIGGTQATAPSCSPTSATPTTSPVTVTCTNPNSGTTIMCYTEDGTNPITNLLGTNCTHGTPLSGSSNTITISSAVTTLDVVAGTSTLSDSTIKSYGAYNVNVSVATPTFNPIAGTYSSTQHITISDTTPSAAIYYTTDGSTPTTGSTLYSGTITISSTQTIKAIGVAGGYLNSAVGSALYTINTSIPAPTGLHGTVAMNGTGGIQQN